MQLNVSPNSGTLNDLHQVNKIIMLVELAEFENAALFFPENHL